MDRRQMCVSNVKYKKPSQSESRRNKNLLKYLTYVRQEAWLSQGLNN